MNFHSILMDLFGASLMSGNPHQEVVDEHDVRRHGGGMGVWLGIWTWCFTGSIGVGFLIGAGVINSLNPSWGFYISIVLIVVVLILNVFCPEVRRSAYRRSVVEVRKGTDVSRRLARGEVKMHRVKDGPTWWGQEVYHGILLSLEMLRQPGFAIIALYTGWIYAQVVLFIVLLGSLTSRSYRLRSPLVGTCVAFISIGALTAVPFQKANIFSRGRHHQGLAMAECNGLVMETFDTSDLQPGMTGRPRAMSSKSSKRTNYSSFPRVTAGIACCQTLGFIFAAGATALGGMAQRDLGQKAATGVVAGILFVLTLLLLAALIRFKNVQIIPEAKKTEMEKWTNIRRESIRRHSPLTEEEMWRPVIIGNPSSKERRVNVLELGHLSRWTEIRKKNRLIDESNHLNRAALESARNAVVEEAQEIGAKAAGLVRSVSSRSLQRSNRGTPKPTNTSGERTPHRNIPGHRHTPGGGGGLSERDCVMGQPLSEEDEDLDEEGAEDDEVIGLEEEDALAHEDDDYKAREHAAHMTPKVQNALQG
ncbi:Polyamine transport protein [Coniochaeta hoffmannii]|uniref:Polyamine transport protein n=1 Tax=Coniochaeta hoffmannii TaxID=91930 RepID=A0AA38RAQ3_9PEZI|nr:Polyamine transport protein [Coniochaeta hoffmannii]